MKVRKLLLVVLIALMLCACGEKQEKKVELPKPQISEVSLFLQKNYILFPVSENLCRQSYSKIPIMSSFIVSLINHLLSMIYTNTIHDIDC
jgi:hypothetical protein